MRDLSRFRRFVTMQAIQQATDDWDEHGVLANALKVLNATDYVYEQADDFEERLGWKEEHGGVLKEQEIAEFAQNAATWLIQEGVGILGLHAALKLLVGQHGVEHLTARLAVLAEEKATAISQ